MSDKTTLKSYFKTGDKPTQAQFSDFIDSVLGLAETSAQTIRGSIIVSGAVTVSGATNFYGNITMNANAASAARSAIGCAVVSGAQTFIGAQRATLSNLTSTGNSIAVNLALNNNFSHTFTENTTLANPSGIVAGQSGAIMFTQHASSPKTLAYGSFWKFAGGTVPAVTSANSAVDTLFYNVRSTTFIECNLVKAWA